MRCSVFPLTEATLRDLHFKWLTISYREGAPAWAASFAAQYEAELRELAATEQRLKQED